MKTQLRTLAAILLFAFSVSANTGNADSTKELSVNEIVSASVNYIEPLSIEEWMTDDNAWNHATSNDQSLKIESWMTNDALWTNKAKSVVESSTEGNRTIHVFRMSKEKEAPLSIETWMTDDKAWRL